MAQQSTLESLATYISGALNNPLPPEVDVKTRHHVLDTIAAMVTGSRLKPGEAAIKFVRSQGGVQEAAVVGSNVVTTAINAAMANGMLAHSDETDDSHAPSLTHPGCAVVPAALAVAERQNASGEALVRAVALGYDVGSRVARVMGGINARGMHGHATHTIGPMFGATAAAAALVGLDPQGVRYALSYTAQQASGITSWARDSEHIEKSFVFGGNGARNGVTSALFVASGMTAEEDAFEGHNGFLEVFCPMRDEFPEWVASLGSHYEISITNIKKFSIGSPIQAAAEAMTQLVSEHNLKPDDITNVDVLLPPQGAHIVDGRHMPDVNLQYCMAAIALDGGKLTFEATHTYERLSDPAIVDLMAKVHLHGNPEFAEMERQRPATVRIQTTTGLLERHVPAVRGTADSPMTLQEIDAKVIDLIGSIYGEQRGKDVVSAVRGLNATTPASWLRQLLTEG
ncbi:MAG: MmgE/PrpD family protein [Chloroflexi bacterium]|nr:MmgE/PrpD family protein [Chloroflexota bacterium]